MTNRITAGRVTYGSRQLSASRASLLFGTALGVSIAIVAASPNQAWAADECGADVGGVAVCTSVSGVGNPYPVGIDYVADAGEDITVILDGTVDVITGTDDGVTATNANAGYDSVIDIYYGAVVVSAYDGAVSVAVGAGGDAYVYNGGDVTAGSRGLFSYAASDAYVGNSGSVYVDGTASAAGYAIGAIANGVDSSVVANSGDVTVVGAAGDFSVGLYAYNATSAAVTSSGAVDVTAYGAGDAYGVIATATTAATVTTYAGGAIDVYSTGTGTATGIDIDSGGTAVVIAGDDISVEALGGNAYGMNVSGATVVDVSITGDIYSDVDDYTANNYGILATSTGFTTDVTVVGDITLSDGLNATGIDASGLSDVTVDVTGNIQVGDYAGTPFTYNATGIEATSSVYSATVDVTGNVSAFGATTATGIEAVGIVSAYVGVTGDVTAAAGAGDATGIYADGNLGASSIVVAGATNVYSAAGDATGIQALSAASDASVSVTGDIDVDGSTSAYAIEVDTDVTDAADSATVIVTGNLTADSTTGFAEGVDVYAGGDVYVDVNGVITATSGAGAYGVFALSYYGDVEVNVGDVNVTAVAGGAGVDVFAFGLDGAGDAAVTAGNIVATGDNTEGVSADAIYGAATVTVGNVTTSGLNAEGLDVYAYLDATVTAVDISTTGDGSDGVYAYSFQGDVTVSVNDVTTTGAGAYGVYANAFLGYTTVTAADVSTSGDGATGIYAYAFNDVDVTAASVTTTGAGAFGIEAYSFIGATTVDAGTVSTSGAGSTGIDAYGFDSTYVSADSVTTTGDGALGIDALGFGGVTVESALVVTSGASSTGISAVSLDSYVYVDSGTVDTTGDGADGIYAVSQGTDATDYVTVYSDAITTAGAAADGIVAFAAGGDILIDSGTIDTLGDGAYGIYAYAALGDVTIANDAITTAGVNADGIYAYAFFGATSVTSGSVSTLGDDSDGIYAYGYLGATVVSDTVTTAGADSEGIEARSQFNAVSVDSGSVTTTGDYSTGILAFGYGGTTVVSDTVSTSGYGSEGIVALDILGPVSVTSGDVTTTGDYSNGIRAGSFYDVTVDSGTVTTSGDSSIGIEAYSLGGALGDGSVDVTFDSVVTNGGAVLDFTVPYAAGNFYYYLTPSHGIVATAATGEVSVVGGDVTTNGLGASGIIASGFGDVYVYVDDVTTTGGALLYYDGPTYTTYYASAGIDASVTGGDVTVIADTVTTSGYGAAGIVATGFAYYDSLGTPTFYGDTLVVANDVVTNGDFADGVFASNYGGDTTVVVDTVTTFGEGSDGIIAVAGGYYDSAGVQTLYGDVVVNANSVTTYGDDAYGVIGVTASGDVFIDVGSVSTSGEGSVGIYAAAFNYYDSSLGAEQNLHGDVFVEADSVTTSGDFATGIFGYAEGGNVNIYAGSVVTSGEAAIGINAIATYYGPDPVLLTYYSGDANVFADSVTTYGDNSTGIYGYAAGGNVRIYAGSVYAGGLDADAIVAVTGGLDASNSNDIYIETTGAIYSFDGVGIRADSAGGVVVDVDSGSVYGYDWGIQSYSVLGTYIDNDGYVYGGEGRAIDVDGASATIFNGGVILGFVDLTDGDDYIYNNGLWEAYGTSDFGLGTDLVVNAGTVGFSRYNAGSQTTTFASLEYFDNYGSVSGVDQEVGDSLVISGNFFGGAGSELDIDVELGGPGSIADTLVIGSASGVTSIDPNDVLAGTPGALNFGGILVVDSANAAETGAEFVMDNVDKGFIEYELFFDAANDDWLIVGLPDHEAFEMLGVMSGAQDFWRRSGDALTARWQEVRDASPDGTMAAGPGGMGRSEGWELWMQAHAGVDGYDNPQVFSVGGFTFAEDLSTTTDWRGFQFGFDNMSGNTIWGLTMGFTQQETNFDATSNSFDFEGWNVGAYGGWAAGGFFLNGLVKGDFYEVDGNFNTVPAMFTFDGVTWGAMGEIGYRWEGSSMFFEPVAQLAWTTTDLDRVTTSGATIDFDDATSLRAKAGARIGGTFGSGDIVLTPYVGVYWVDELEGENGLTFATGPTSFTIDDTAREDHGQVDFGFTTQTFYGLEGFVKGEWNFGGDADGGGVRMGARWRW